MQYTPQRTPFYSFATIVLVNTFHIASSLCSEWLFPRTTVSVAENTCFSHRSKHCNKHSFQIPPKKNVLSKCFSGFPVVFWSKTHFFAISNCFFHRVALFFKKYVHFVTLRALAPHVGATQFTLPRLLVGFLFLFRDQRHLRRISHLCS